MAFGGDIGSVYLGRNNGMVGGTGVGRILRTGICGVRVVGMGSGVAMGADHNDHEPEIVVAVHSLSGVEVGDRQTDKQTDRQTDRETQRHGDRDRETDAYCIAQRDMHTSYRQSSAQFRVCVFVFVVKLVFACFWHPGRMRFGKN